MDCDPEMVAEGVLGGPRPALGGQGVVNGEGEGVSVLHVEPPGFCLRRNPGCTLVRQGEKERGTGGQLEAEGVFEHLLLVWSSRPSRWGPWDRTPSRPGAPAPPAPPPPPQARLPPTLVRVPVQFLLLFPCELSPAALEWSPSPLSAFAGSLPPARHGLLLSRLLRRSLTARLSHSLCPDSPSFPLHMATFVPLQIQNPLPWGPWETNAPSSFCTAVASLQPSRQRLVMRFEKVVQKERKGCEHTMPSKRYL